MKTRQGFVSNSSSSSFLINNYKLSPKQIEQIKNHLQEGKNYGITCSCTSSGHTYKYDEWNITEDDGFIHGSTNMDNFDMHEFLEKIGVKSEDVEWSD